MQHIPEAELHAYLDQALDRLRCVDIESHLAECTPCRSARDEIAALRDRTTAMLARLAPRGTVPPPIAEIRRRAAARVFQRERFRQRVAWAASVVLALGMGWGGARYLAPRSSTHTGAEQVKPAPVAISPTPADRESTPSVLQALAAAPGSAAEPSALEHRPEASSPASAPRHAQHRSVTSPGRSDELATAHGERRDGQVEPASGDRSASGERPNERAGSRVEGIPVAEVQAADSTRKPSMVVAQQLKSGEVVRTVQGPVADVSTLLTVRPTGPAESSADGAEAGAPSVGNSFSFRNGDRVFTVTGNLPSDSLRALMRRLNLMSGVR